MRHSTLAMRWVLVMLVSIMVLPLAHTAFLSPHAAPFLRSQSLKMSSFVADGSEYSPKDSDFDRDDDETDSSSMGGGSSGMADVATVELQPIPLSKNSGNRFVALVWDRELDQEQQDALDLHYNRIQHTEDHVMFCRKANLYNETFNTESMVDILWSYPILASDLKRVIGHAMCLESTELKYVQDLLRKEPIIQSLTGGDISKIPLYRWWHIRDYTLRQDDGRVGTPAMLLAMDDADAELREETKNSHLEYLIKSERVVAAGPLHVATPEKNDPSSIAVGDLVFFNAKNREDAIEFAEEDPRAQAGLYDNMRVHFYNNLDVTGKFVSEDVLREDTPCADMQEALEYWGYPTADHQTPWLNW